MTDLKSILTLTSKEFAIFQFNRKHKTRLIGSDVTVQFVEKKSDSIVVSINGSTTQRNTVPVVGECLFEYKRLSLPEIFGPLIRLNLSPNLTTWDLFAAIELSSGIRFDASDFSNQPLSHYGQLISPLPNSLRWEIPISLAEPLDTRFHIDTLITQNYLRGFLR